MANIVYLATRISTSYHHQTKCNKKLHHPRVGQIKRTLPKIQVFRLPRNS